MTKIQLNSLLLDGGFPGEEAGPELVETNSSWVILCDDFVFKIKKPVRYSFLDFSTLDKRKYYCEREVELNRRLTTDIYLDVQPVKELAGHYHMGSGEGKIVDYAVRMRKMDRNRQMDVLLLNNTIIASDIMRLAEKMATFHKRTTIIYEKDVLTIRRECNDLKREEGFLQENMGEVGSAIIDYALDTSGAFIRKNQGLLSARLAAGFFRDCHGDLHSGNIFLLPDPQPFDCIEFDDELRRIDVLDEVAFLCMDLDAYGRQDLSQLFIHQYNKLFPVIRTEMDQLLFIFYKSYRANIRAKINSLHARAAVSDNEKRSAMALTGKYLDLMVHYLENTNKTYSKTSK